MNVSASLTVKLLFHALRDTHAIHRETLTTIPSTTLLALFTALHRVVHC
jgi:hypothetical protein